MQNERSPVANPLGLYELPSVLEPLALNELFATSQPLEIELGSGDGSFLVEYARKNPGRNFIGVERLLGRARKLDRKARRAGLTNLRVIRIESAYFLRYLLPKNSAEALHLYFPDPWPKRRHWRHRLVNPQFPALALTALASGGTVYLRTDNSEYFEQMQEVFTHAPAFHCVATPSSLLELRTDFETDFHAAGIPTLHAAYRRK